MTHTPQWSRNGPWLERLLGRIYVKCDNGCWEWRGAHFDTGYGQIMIDRRLRGVHRVVYELLKGPIPDGLFLDHLCRNPPCCNPAHLEPVTNGENILRGEGWGARNARKTHCLHGHPYDEKNTYLLGKSRSCRTCRARRDREHKARKRASVT